MYIIMLLAMFFSEPQIPDGTLLFVEGGSQIVMDYTESPYSHVAIIFNENQKPYVFEAVRPVCRKILLEDYIKSIEAENFKKDKQMKLWIRKPNNLSPEDANNMKNYCLRQIGRKYRISSYLSGKSVKGIHCGEMTARAMIAGGMNIQENPCDRSPQDIMNLSSKWYGEATML